MTIQTIRSTLETKLKGWADSQSIPVAFEEVTFDKPTGVPFLECFLIPNITMNRDVSAATVTEYGLFQVNCWAPNGSGMGVVQGIAQSICNLFPIVPKSGPISIEATPSIGRSISDKSGGWVILPVLIKYRCES